jgi:type IV pilus assembly protein PilZ
MADTAGILGAGDVGDIVVAVLDAPVAMAKRYGRGDEVFILLTLMEDKDRLPIAGKVIWVTPPGAQGNRTAGIGVQFNESADGETARVKIEAALAGIMNADRPTHTM